MILILHALCTAINPLSISLMGTKFGDSDGALMAMREVVGAPLPGELARHAMAAQVQDARLLVHIPVIHLAVDMHLVTWVQALILTARTISWVPLGSSA